MNSYAIYRLPHQEYCVVMKQLGGDAVRLSSYDELSGKKGFVFAPFANSDKYPILLIQPDEVKTIRVKELSEKVNRRERTSEEVELKVPDASEKDNYALNFANYHAQLEKGRFRKIVLSRCSEIEGDCGLSPEQLFVEACERYPRLFVCLVSIPLAGTWLMATPEVLLEGDGENWHTMALAGTMKLEDAELNTEGETISWSPKNIQEQRVVASYITECLKRFTDHVEEEGPYTARAANLVHLRSDFTFTLKDTQHLGGILQMMHPTPAVCGLPKDETRDFILANEHESRSYYSGFCGPIDPDGETHLYVSLRCMNITKQGYRLFAGGGIMKESEMESEWQETVNKMGTMMNLIRKE